MNRNDFLCRAKLPVGTKWMYGCIVYRTNDNFMYMLENGSKTWMHVINPQTVCKCSGLEDMRGNKIFENDIHEFDGRLYIIRYGRFKDCEEPGFGWYMESAGSSSEQYGFSGNESDYVNIVGNVFDNPDLLYPKVETPSER